MPSALRLLGQPKCAIRININRTDRVHLDRDLEGHMHSPVLRALDYMARDAREFNAAASPLNGILANIDLADIVHQGHVKAAGRIQTCCQSAKIILGT